MGLAGALGKVVGFAGNHPLLTTSAVLGGTAVVHGAAHAKPQGDQIMGYMHEAQQDAGAPVKKFAEVWDTVKAAHFTRYEEFAAAQKGVKTAGAALGGSFGQTMLNSFSDALVKVVAKTLFEKPLSKAFDIIDKKLYLEPRQRNVLLQVVQSDPVLSQKMEKQPEVIIGAYSTMKQYAPSLTVNAAVLKNFLLNSIATNGMVDPMTVKLLAETEKNVRMSRGQIGAGGHE